jgi:hypothetical protein
MVWVDSSNIEAIGYDGDNLELWVQFLNGRTYVYDSVPAHVFDELMASPSKGSYFNRIIKPGYQFRSP